jgi:hypothetical protein
VNQATPSLLPPMPSTATSNSGAASSVAATAPIPFGVDRPELGPSAAQGVWAVLWLTVGLAALLWWLRRRTGGASHASVAPWAGWLKAPTACQLQVLERSPVGPGCQLVVVRYGSRQLLLSISAQHSQCLRDDFLPEAEAPASSGPEAGP